MILAIAAASGCGAASQEVPAAPERPVRPAALAVPRPTLADAEAGGWIVAPPPPAYRPAARTLLGGGPITIGDPAPPPEPTRPKRRGHIALNLQAADLENAMRLLAEAGGFNLVVQAGLTGSVSAKLDGVDPYDALVALAEANGAEVRYERGIVIVRRPAR
jgi:hypothetical protein